MAGSESRYTGEDYTELQDRDFYIYLYINAYVFIEPLPRTAGLASLVHSSSRGPAGQTQRWSYRRLGRTLPGTGGAERRWEETEREELEDVRCRSGPGEGRRLTYTQNGRLLSSTSLVLRSPLPPHP